MDICPEETETSEKKRDFADTDTLGERSFRIARRGIKIVY